MNFYLKILIPLLPILFAFKGQAATIADPETLARGKKAFDYFCYQCHGYAGDAKTLASRFLAPPPRDFTRADPAELSADRMLFAVTEGRPATAMKSFSRVLDRAEREAVVAYIRQEFMQGEPASGKYHTEANGWPDHRQKYSLAYPFASGEIATDTPAQELTEEQIIGRELFRTSCVSCHDQGAVRVEEVIWRARSSSWPRRHYDHRLGPWDVITSATPYQRHDQAPDVGDASLPVQSGQLVFLENCAFCHGADGTGKNWIGSFMEPPAADLTGPRIALYSEEKIRHAILNGVPGGSMPAWDNLLSSSQLDQLVAYLFDQVLGSGPASDPGGETVPATPPAVLEKPVWKRQQEK